MATYRRVYDSRHLQADCQEPVSVPEPYARQSSMDYLNLYLDWFIGCSRGHAGHCHVRGQHTLTDHATAVTCNSPHLMDSGVRRMNEVNARRARLVPGWVTVFGRVWHLGM